MALALRWRQVGFRQQTFALPASCERLGFTSGRQTLGKVEFDENFYDWRAPVTLLHPVLLPPGARHLPSLRSKHNLRAWAR